MHHISSLCWTYFHHFFSVIYKIQVFFFYLSLQVEIAPDDLSNLVLCIFLLTHGDKGDQKGVYDVGQKQKT